MLYLNQLARGIVALLVMAVLFSGLTFVNHAAAQSGQGERTSSAQQGTGSSAPTPSAPTTSPAPSVPSISSPSASSPATRPSSSSQSASPAPQQQQQRSPNAPPPPAGKEDDEEPFQNDDVVRVETDLTNILFTAADKDKRLVTTLRQEDIRILENGVPQDVFTFERQTDLPLSLAILIDTSASQERTLPDEKAAARGFLDSVVRLGKDEIAVVSFTGEATLEQSLTGNRERARQAIDRVQFVPPSGYIGNGRIATGTPPIADQSLAGSTAIWDAIWVTSEEVLAQSSERTRRAIVLVSDGVDTSSQKKLKEAVDRAVKFDVIVYAVGIGDAYQFDGVDEGSLRKVTERTGGRAYYPQSEMELRAAFSQIQQELRSQYLIAYSPKNKVRDGSFRPVKIEVVNPDLRKQKLRLTYRQGYFARTPATASTASPTTSPKTPK